MAIIELNGQILEHQCVFCNTTQQTNVSELLLGQKLGDQFIPQNIPLPACSNCGAQETVFGADEDAPEHPSPGSYGHKHQLLVDELQRTLAQNDQLVEGMPTEQVSYKQRSQEELTQWFESGQLRLERKSNSPESQNNDEVNNGQ